MLTRQEKERLVIDLYNQGKTFRDIAKELRVSFRDIGTILKKTSNEKAEKQGIKEILSLSTKAYRLFSKGKTPIEVAITLNLNEAETSKFYEEYWNLTKMHELRMVYDEIGPNIVYFLRLYKLCKEAHMNPKNIVSLLRTANNDVPALERKYLRLKKEIGSLELEKHKSKQIGNQAKIFALTLEYYKRQTEELHRKKVRLEGLLKQFENNETYKKVRQTVEGEVNNTLSKNNNLLKLAVSSVLESIIRDPERYNFLVNSNFYNNGKEIVSSPYIEVYRSLILDEAQKVFEIMRRDLTDRIINDSTSSSLLIS